MKSYFSEKLKVLVQGATGREGQRAVDFMQKYYTAVLAGVTPGKGGAEVLGVPVFDSIGQARKKVGELGASVICVPPQAVRLAVAEAVENGITFIQILTEGVPYKDLAYVNELCRTKGVKLLGPGSLGILSVGEGRLGFLGGLDADIFFKSGHTSLISRSGGMTNEIARFLCNNGIGLRVVVHLGADLIQGTTLAEQVRDFSFDSETHAIAVFEEVVNNSSLAGLVDFLERTPVKKPICVALAGRSQFLMPAGAPFGHADALLRQDESQTSRSLERLTGLGVKIVDSYEKIPEALMK